MVITTQSFGMSRIFSRVSKVGTRLAAQARTQLTSAKTRLSQSATLARLMPSNKLVAKRMLYASGAGIAMATAAHADNAKEAQKELTPEQMKEKLDELARTEEWNREQMQAKFNELKAVEEAAKEAAFAITQPYPVLEYNVEGVYTVRSLEELGRLQFMKNHAALFAKCISREGTDRSKFPESGNKQANECADLWKKAYGLINSQKNVPEYDEFHFTFRRLLKGIAYNQDVFEKTNMVELPAMNCKVETSVDINSADTVDLKKLAEEGHSAQFKVRERVILPYTAMYEIFPLLREKRYGASGLKCDFAPTLASFSYQTPLNFGNLVVNKAEGKMSIEYPSKVVHVCIHGQSKAPCQECSK